MSPLDSHCARTYPNTKNSIRCTMLRSRPSVSWNLNREKRKTQTQSNTWWNEYRASRLEPVQWRDFRTLLNNVWVYWMIRRRGKLTNMAEGLSPWKAKQVNSIMTFHKSRSVSMRHISHPMVPTPPLAYTQTWLQATQVNSMLCKVSVAPALCQQLQEEWLLSDLRPSIWRFWIWTTDLSECRIAVLIRNFVYSLSNEHPTVVF